MLSHSSRALAHTLFELAAYFVGVRLFLRAKERSPNPVSAHPEGLWVLVGAVLGAAIGSKVLFWLQFPAYAWADFPNPLALLGGKTIVGGLLGGLLGVELAKRRVGVTASTGDLFVAPLLAGTVIGRLGCLVAGLGDYTYGNPTQWPWGLDLGDGVARHPVAAYEILFLLLLGLLLRKLSPCWRQPGDGFRAFLASYLAWRFAVDFLKPPHFGFAPALQAQPPALLYFGVLTGIQIACLVGLAYYATDLRRFIRELPRGVSWLEK